MLDCQSIAEGAGVELRQRGGKLWGRCPLHHERTPSFAIYPDGRGWYCFSCHRGGDAAALYQLLYNVPIREALRAVGKDQPIAPVRSAGEELRRKVEHWRDDRWDAACRALHAAETALEGAEKDDNALWDALETREQATLALDELQGATPRELVALMNAERIPADDGSKLGRAGARA